jgi:DNA-binding response OmpR family regulator
MHSSEPTHTILVVDDDHQISDLVAVVCRPLPVQIVSAYTGMEGLSIAKALRPSLMVVDLLLPGSINGWEMIRLMQSDAQLYSIPVIILTATGAALDHDAGNAHYVAHFKKPFAPKELRECIEENLR